MKLVSGHTYLRGPTGEIVPYHERLATASGYEKFVQDGDFENDLQLAANQLVVARKPKPVPMTDNQQEIQELQERLKQLQQSEKPQGKVNGSTPVGASTPQPVKANGAQSVKASTPQPVKPSGPQPVKVNAPQPVKQSFPDGHMDITNEMASDLAGLE